MDWKKERDLLIAQTLAFVQSVTGKAPDLNPAPLEPSSPEQTSLEQASFKQVSDVEETANIDAKAIATPKDIPNSVQLGIQVPRAMVSSDIRSEMQARVANFRAHQERFHREREEYFSATLREVRTVIAPSAPELLTPRHADPGPRSSPAPAAGAARTPAGFSLIGKWPRPFMMVTSLPATLLATASVSSGVQE